MRIRRADLWEVDALSALVFRSKAHRGYGARFASLAALLLAVLSSLAAGTSARPARAQALRYDAPAGCPDRAAFEARVRARSQRPGRTARALEVELAAGDGGIVGRISVRDGDGSLTRRRIVAADCEEAVDALALIAALALESATPDDASTPPDDTAVEPARKARPAPARDQRRTRRPVGARGAAADDAAEEALDEPEPEPRPDTDAGDPPAPRATSGRATDGDTEITFDDDERTTVGAELFASALALSGAAPNPQPAAEIGAAVAVPIARAAALRVRLSARLSGTQRADAARDQGTAELRLWSGAGALCPGTSLSEALWLFGCGVFEAGAISASGSDTDDPRDEQRTWLAAGGGVELTWLVVPPLRLHANVEGLAPLYRDRFLIGDQVVHHVPGLAARAALGVGVALW